VAVEAIAASKITSTKVKPFPLNACLCAITAVLFDVIGILVFSFI